MGALRCAQSAKINRLVEWLEDPSSNPEKKDLAEKVRYVAIRACFRDATGASVFVLDRCSWKYTSSYLIEMKGEGFEN